MDIGGIIVIVIIVAFMPFVYITTRIEKPIKNIDEMKIHCKVVSKDKDYYWKSGIRCGVICCYREECEKYIKRYNELPNGDKEIIRSNYKMESEKAKEIKKALECCQGESLKSCEHCPYWNICKEDDGLTFKSDILTYINELEDLCNKTYDNLTKEIDRLEKENARLLDGVETVQSNR